MFDRIRGRQAAKGVPRTPPPVPPPTSVVSGLRAEWRRVARLLADPAVELDADEFVSVLSVYQRLKSLGAKIDPMAEALILQGLYGLASTEACLDG